MTDRLREIKARREKITPPPWEARLSTDENHPQRHFGIVAPSPGGRVGKLVVTANASAPGNRLEDYWVQARAEDLDFIAHAPADMDWLVARVAEMRDLLERVRRAEDPEEYLADLGQLLDAAREKRHV